MLFGLGEGLLIVSFTGASPWSVFKLRYFLECKFKHRNNYILNKYFCFDFMDTLALKPGMGTILNALIIALMIDLCIKFVPTPSNYYYQLILAIISVLAVGIGGGIYLVSNLGAGPRDGLMIGLQKISNQPVAVVRAFLEISVVSRLVFRWNCRSWHPIICFWHWSLCRFRLIFGG